MPATRDERQQPPVENVDKGLLRLLAPQDVTCSLLVVALSGFVCGCGLVAGLQQAVISLGNDRALWAGWILATVLGCWWAKILVFALYKVWDQARWLWVFLVAAWGLWVGINPYWLSTLQSVTQISPTGWWNIPGFLNVVEIIVGALSLIFPMLLTGVVWSQSLLKGSQRGDISFLTGILLGACLHLVVFAPHWGISAPVWSSAGAVALLLSAVVMHSPNDIRKESVTRTSLDGGLLPRDVKTVDATKGTAKAHGSVCGISAYALLVTSALFHGELLRMVTQLWPTTALQWHLLWISMLIGWLMAGVLRKLPICSTAMVLMVWVSTSVLLQRTMLNWSLIWMATISHPLLLETTRGVLMLLILSPAGWLARSTIHPAGSSLQDLGLPHRACLWGFGCWLGATYLPLGASLVAMPVVAAQFLIITLVSRNVENLPQTTHEKFGLPLLTSLVMFVSLGHGWQFEPSRAQRLLFSTMQAVAAQSGWSLELLPYLDDRRLLFEKPSHAGWLTCWQLKGGECQWRLQGIPRGSTTRDARWYPQHPAEIIPLLWPMALHDAPQRVLILGARSGATLQAALYFPVNEVICREPDAVWIDSCRTHVIQTLGYDPLADERCRWWRQPLTWPLPTAHARFDIIVSQPPTPGWLPAGSEYTREFYQHMAAGLAPKGIFSQCLTTADYGPKTVMSVIQSLQAVFPYTLGLEIAPGHLLLLAAHEPEVLIRMDLPQRLEQPLLLSLLTSCQWDWAYGLNLPAYDHTALRDAAAELAIMQHDYVSCLLPLLAGHELLRWGNKAEEWQGLMSQPYRDSEMTVTSGPGVASQPKKRQQRYLDWLGPAADDPHLLRRLGQEVAMLKLIQLYPDSYWWEYRKELREQLQQHPRTSLMKVRYEDRWHPEDLQRKNYFETLGRALRGDDDLVACVQQLEDTLEPYDPLLSFFGHFEIAEVLSRHRLQPERELLHRLHGIYFSPGYDVSLRNIHATIELILRHPELPHGAQERFDLLNGLLQILRTRWEMRAMYPKRYTKVVLQDVERSLIISEKALAHLEELHPQTEVSKADWSGRKLALEQLLLHPLRGAREHLRQQLQLSQFKTTELWRRTIDHPSLPAALTEPSPAVEP